MKLNILLIPLLFSCGTDVEVQEVDTSLVGRLVSHLPELIDPDVVYDPQYTYVVYPCGDVPEGVGVCSDVVIRAFMKVDICLQKEVFEFRKAQGQHTDKNIDHRRVRCLGPYFESLGYEIPVGGDLDYYQPGDIIWWKLSGGLDHIGIVMEGGGVLHNIGMGQTVMGDPFSYEIHKVYRVTG